VACYHAATNLGQTRAPDGHHHVFVFINLLLLLRYTRVLFIQSLKRQLIDYLGYGLAREGMSVVDRTVTPDA